MAGILPYAGGLAPFTYGFTEDGTLVPLNDTALLAQAAEIGTAGVMHLSTLTERGTFSAERAAALLVDEAEKEYPLDTPAEKLEHSKILWVILVVAGFAYIVYYFVQNGFTLGLNIVNMIFLFLGILLHGDLRRYVDAIGEAAAGAAGILLQFPFYAGIMGMMVAANEQGVSLASVISQFFVNISNSITFPMLSFLAAGIVNFFVPSGGGQWAVQGPIMMPAGANLGIDAGRTAMAIAWGDQWTNMIQPFWALPALGIAKLSARDIMGYLVIVLLFTGVVACLGFLAWGLWF